jgi:hypothetical protein
MIQAQATCGGSKMIKTPWVKKILAVKIFMIQTPVGNVIKLFTAVITSLLA